MSEKHEETIQESQQRQLADLREEARLNASMLARQTDLAREAEEKLVEKDAALKEAKADAESWYEQCESARDALIQNGRDSDAALSALAEALQDMILIIEDAIEYDPSFLEDLPEFGRELERARLALAPEAVQRAVEASKAKDEEIERLGLVIAEVRSLNILSSPTQIQKEAHRIASLVEEARLSEIVEHGFRPWMDLRDELEAKLAEKDVVLAVAMGLLGDAAAHYSAPMTPELLGGIEQFLVGSRQMVAEYREALEHNKELEQLFDAQQQREIEAILRWRAESPAERALSMPDYGRLLDWLKEKLDEANLALDLTQPLHDQLVAERDEALAVVGRVKAARENLLNDAAWLDNLLGVEKP